MTRERGQVRKIVDLLLKASAMSGLTLEQVADLYDAMIAMAREPAKPAEDTMAHVPAPKWVQ